MSLRKQIERENATVSAESQEDDASSDRDEVSSLAATREIRKRERESKNKEMTEEEMMALALRLSEQEASITARRLQEEEEAVKKAIQDSMFAESQGLLDAAAASSCISSRRKLVYSNGESRTDTERSTTHSGEDGGQRAAGHVHRIRKRRHVEGSPLTEMPDLSQTQPSVSSYETAPQGSQSPQSCDSTQIEDLNLPPSPVFPSCSAQARVRVPRLDRELLESCTASGFVLLSQESAVTTQRSHCQQPARSPTFPNNPAPRSQKAEVTKSQMCDSGDETQPELSREPRTSPVFGQTDHKGALGTDTTEATALTFSSQESSTSFCLEKDVSLSKSPVFSKTQEGELDRGEGSERQSPVFGTSGWEITTQQSLSQTEPPTDMTLHWSEEDDDDATPVVSPSPVFPDERNDLRTPNESEGSAEPQAQSRTAAPPVGSGVGEVPGFSGDMAPQSTVHYYWGVPFCPRGLDPDQYTKVIVAQMEVYEKSLKQAQRGFLNKAKWGEPILPQPEKSPSPEPNSPQRIFPKRRSWRLRGKLRELESEEEVDEMTQDTQRSPRTLWEEEEAHEEEDKEMTQNAEEEEAGLEQEEGRQKKPMEEAALEQLREDGAQGESDCEVCPETQLSDDNTQELTLPSQPLLRSPEIETIQVDSPNVPEPQSPQTPEPKEPMVQGPESAEEPMESTIHQHGNTDLEGPHCESQSRESPRPSQPSHLDQDMDSQEPTEPDLGPGPDLVSREESSVQCPLCQRVFPSDQIEMHAAFCDGGPEAAGDKASSKPRRKRLRRGEAENANHTHSESSVALEKCYVCLKAVPLRDYSFHTDRCFLRPGLRTANTGGLLSALDKSEHRDSEAGPSGSTAQPQEVINLVDDDEEEDSVSLIQISSSPIRSFTTISDAQDCLIDFSRQHQGKRPGTRLGTKHRSKRR